MMLGDEVISPLLQKELDARVTEAGGDIEFVKRQLEEELKNLESGETDAESATSRRGDIALILGQIQYLDKQEMDAQSVEKAESPSLMGRIRHALHANG